MTHDAPSSTSPVTVFLLDDHELVRRGLRDLLESEGFSVIGETDSAVEAVRRIPALAPDVTILDARLTDGNGIEVCRDVRSVDPTLQCVILTSYDDDDAVRGAILAGAAGYILKEILGSDLLDKVRRASRGEMLFDEEVKARVIAGFSAVQPEDPRLAGLTVQEKKVLALIGAGMTNREIGAELFLAEKTIKNYVSSVLAKLGFLRRTQAAVYISRPQTSAPHP
nr:response regulator transcription factor [Arthrobacter sp. CAN_C5]